MSLIIEDIKLMGGDNIELANIDTNKNNEIIIYKGIYNTIDSL